MAHALVRIKPAVFAGGDASTLLAAMLLSVQAQVRELGRLTISVDADDRTHLLV